MRWAQFLDSPYLVVNSHPFDQVRLSRGDCTLVLGPDAEGRKATVGVALVGDQLAVSVLAEGLHAYGSRPDHEEWYNRAHLAVLLNPKHDHATRWTVAVDDRGEVIQEAHFVCSGEELNDDAARPLDWTGEASGTFAYLDDARFFAQVFLSAQDVWNEAGLAGLSLRIGFHEIPMPDSLAWPERVDWTKESPLIFGDLYRQSSELCVHAMDLGRPFWGGTPSPIFLNCAFSGVGTHSGSVSAEIDLPNDGVFEQGPFEWCCEGTLGKIEVPLVFPFRAKWANGLQNVARLKLSVRREDGALLWQGAFPFGFDTGILVREKFGGDWGGRPRADDADFLNAFRAFILSRLPNYIFQTTREGAPSDFYLVDPDGKASVNLSDSNALDSVAAMITSRFSNWQDALCAAAMWVHHPCVTRHSSTWSRVSNNASIDTIPRLAGCFCGDTTRLTAVLAEKIGARLNVPVKGLAMGLRGHLATLVTTPIGQIVIDGMLGLWFHTLDNTRLATLEEMRENRDIAERVWYAPRAHGHEFFYGVDNQLIRAYKQGNMVWPVADDGR